MAPKPFTTRITRRILIVLLGAFAVLPSPLLPIIAVAEVPLATDALASWNEGPAKQAIIDFVKETTDKSSPDFVPPEERIATFDQDGTLWVEHPMYSQVVYCLDRVPALVKAKQELANCRALQDGAVWRPRGNGEAINTGPRKDPLRHAHWDDGRHIRCGSQEVDRRS